jgi:DNA-directed RNA polymerase alpha subunit
MILEAVPARRQDSRTCIRPSTRTSRHYAEALIMTAKIARAHLNEFPDYYTRLAKMEAEAEAEANGTTQGE